MYNLQTEIIIDGNSYPIRRDGDYRLILQVITRLNNIKTDNGKNNLKYTWESIMLFYEGIDDLHTLHSTFPKLDKAFTEMVKFISGGVTQESNTNNLKLIDWEEDENLIVSAINCVAKTEIRALPYMHWWTFISYYMAIGECSLSTIVNIRKKVLTGKKLEKYEKDFKRENPQYFISKKDKANKAEADTLLAKIWNSEEVN
jgi:hypothetical protein